MNRILDVFVDTATAKPFRIQVHLWDTVLTMKQKIEKSQGIPVSKQVLFLGSKVLYDNLDIMQCKIYNNAHIFLVISPDFNPNQTNDQTEKYPSKPSDQSNEFVYPQAWPVMVRSNNDHQVLPQTKPPLLTEESDEEFLMNQDSSVMMDGRNIQALRDICKIQRFGLEKSDISKIIHDQYTSRNMTNVALPSNSSEKFLGIKDLRSVPVGNKNESLPSSSSEEFRGIQTKQSLQSVSVKRSIKVLVQPFQKTTKVAMYVNPDETLKELRKELAKLQRMGVLDLPEDGYYFVHKQNVLTDHLTFEESLVAPFDTIQIFRNEASVPLVTADSVKEYQYSPVMMMQDRNSQVLHRNEQLSVPSKSIGEAIYGQDQYPTTTDPTKQSPSNTTEEIKDDHQDSTKTDQKDHYSSSKSGINIQDSPVKVTNHSKKRKTLQIDVRPFQETRKYPVPVYSDDKVGVLRERLANKNHLGVFALPEGEYFFINKQDVLIDDNTFEENRVASFDTLEILGRKFPVGSSRNDSLRSNSSQELRATQDLPPVPAEKKGIKPKQSPKPVSVKRRINITPDSPERKKRKRMEFTVMVQPFKEETRKIAVNVNSDEKVDELKEKLAKLKEKGELHLPEEGYFLINKQYVLTDHQTFEENLVAPGDTIEIFRGSVTY